MLSMKHDPQEIKTATLITGVCPEMVLAAMIVSQVFIDFQVWCVITSGIDGKHGRNSLHYPGHALDFAGYYEVVPSKIPKEKIPFQKLEEIGAAIWLRLGPEFDVVIEETHIHVEHQPNFKAEAKRG